VARPLRIIDPTAIYHVGSRGCNKAQIIWDDVDCRSFSKELAWVASRYRWSVFAWCLMPNHHHVVLRASEGGFSEGFHQLNGNYSRRTNKRHGRCDHLFKNRPWSRELESHAHLINALVYVLRNPVKAGICSWSHEWAYSSYRATVALEEAPAWLVVGEVLALFGRVPEDAIRELARLVHTDPHPVSDTVGGP
jgi:REP element-mobilizing transposase RayT